MDKYCRVLCMAAAAENKSVTSRAILKIIVNSKSQTNVSGMIFFSIVYTIIKAKKI